MASFDRHSKSVLSKKNYERTTNSTYEENSKSKRSKHKSSRRDKRYESKTPPLPVTTNTSIADLLKQRNYLKEELKKIVKNSDSNLPKKKLGQTLDKHGKDDNPTKMKHSLNKRSENIMRRDQQDKEASPTIIDSEDEETIIEQRRKKRKQILEKFNEKSTTDVSTDNCEETNLDVEKKCNEPKDSENEQLSKIQSDSDVNMKSEHKFKEIPDMFSENDNFTTKIMSEKIVQDICENNTHLTDNWDDEEGYYNIRIGDLINDKRYVIKNILGKGVFANVVQAQDNDNDKMAVAIKIIRNNDLMYSTGLKEITILKKITDADPQNKYHCVKLFHHFIHKGHLCIVLESLYIDLRQIIKKYGKHGLNMKALISYSRQMLTALRFLEKIGVIHADIKPDNLLVNEKKNILKLSDFGSAMESNDNEATPYLVSRFYRAPEIILGIPYSNSVDVWSTACTMFEMATGRILFTGNSNNKMLKCFMDLKGRIPNRLIRKGKFKDQHFNYNNSFLFHKKDEVTGREKFVEICNITPVKELYKELKKYCRDLQTNDEKRLIHFKDILDKMLTIDPSQRMKPKDCLKHLFFSENN